MCKARPRIFNTKPEFIGVDSFIRRILEISEVLQHSLNDKNYTTARNPEFVHFLFPSGKPGKHGYKYVLYDELFDVERQCDKCLKTARKQFLAAYGFDTYKGKFTLDVSPVCISELDQEFMQHIGQYQFASMHHENFIAGFIDCGLSMGSDNRHWLELRDQQDAFRILNVEFRDGSLYYYVANGDQIEYKGDIYDVETLTQGKKWIKTLEKTDDYHCTNLIEDKFSRLWVHEYIENDHLYHKEHSYGYVQDKTHPDYLKPYFHITIGAEIHSLTLVLHMEWALSEDSLANEIRKLKRLNGWIPEVV